MAYWSWHVSHGRSVSLMTLGFFPVMMVCMVMIMYSMGFIAKPEPTADEIEAEAHKNDGDDDEKSREKTAGQVTRRP